MSRIKIEAVKAGGYVFHDGSMSECTLIPGSKSSNVVPVRIIRERDWRKLMKLVHAVDDYMDRPIIERDSLADVLDALRQKAKP